MNTYTDFEVSYDLRINDVELAHTIAISYDYEMNLPYDGEPDERAWIDDGYFF